MAVITVSREYGSRGEEIAQQLSKELGYSYIDKESLEEHFVSLPEQSSGTLIPSAPPKPGQVYSVTEGEPGQLGLYRIELSAFEGSGKLVKAGLANQTKTRDGVKVAFEYFLANGQNLGVGMDTRAKDYHLHLVDMQDSGDPKSMALPILVALASAAGQRPVQDMLAILGDMTLGGTIAPVQHLANTLQCAFDCGARRILLPMVNAADIATVPPELFGKFQISFYTDPTDAVFKAMGMT